MNNTNHIGRLTADPELRRTQDGTPVCTFTLAVRRPRMKDVTDFIDFVVWRQGAEYLCKYGHKGDIVAAIGSLQGRKWTDKNGNNRVTMEIHAESIELLTSKKNEDDSRKPADTYAKPQYTQQNFQKVDEPDAKLPWEF